MWNREFSKWQPGAFAVILPHRLGILDYYASVPEAMRAVAAHEAKVGLLRKWRQMNA